MKKEKCIKVSSIIAGSLLFGAFSNMSYGVPLHDAAMPQCCNAAMLGNKKG
jgi:hypothetical protein